MLTFSRDKIDSDEREYAENMAQTLAGLEGFRSSFAEDVSLYNYCSIYSRIVGDWCFIAARDGAMNLFHFAKTMGEIRREFQHTPKFRTLLDHTKLKGAEQQFKASFPGYDNIRHAVAHAGEVSSTIDKRKEHGFSGDYSDPDGAVLFQQVGSLIMQNALINDRYTTTFAGEIVSYHVSRSSLMILHEIEEKFVSGFASVIDTRWR